MQQQSYENEIKSFQSSIQEQQQLNIKLKANLKATPPDGNLIDLQYKDQNQLDAQLQKQTNTMIDELSLAKLSQSNMMKQTANNLQRALNVLESVDRKQNNQQQIPTNSQIIQKLASQLEGQVDRTMQLFQEFEMKTQQAAHSIKQNFQDLQFEQEDLLSQPVQVKKKIYSPPIIKQMPQTPKRVTRSTAMKVNNGYVGRAEQLMQSLRSAIQ